MLVIYSAEVVECIGYQKNILDICPFVDNPHDDSGDYDGSDDGGSDDGGDGCLDNGLLN